MELKRINYDNVIKAFSKIKDNKDFNLLIEYFLVDSIIDLALNETDKVRDDLVARGIFMNFIEQLNDDLKNKQ